MELPEGSRKLGLYSLLILLALLICINIGLTMWLIASMHFHMDGTGPLHFVKNGIKIDGATYLLDTLHTNKISTSSSSLKLNSPRHIALSSSSSRLDLKANAEIHSSNMSVVNGEGVEVFGVGEHGVRLGLGRVVAQTARLGTALQAGVVQARAGQSLSIQSPTSTLGMYGPGGVSMVAEGGGMSMAAYRDIKLSSSDGQVILNTGSVLLPRLPLVSTNISVNNYSKYAGAKDVTIYQVCSCSTGKIFLSPAYGQCYGKDDLCL